MRDKLSFKYSFELLLTVATLGTALAVLQTFVIGRHYIIPTGLLCITVLLGNIAWYGFRDHPWAKQLLFWIGFLLTSHAFFALFWSKRYREILGDSFELVCAIVVLLLGFLTVQYARRNALFSRAG